MPYAKWLYLHWHPQTPPTVLANHWTVLSEPCHFIMQFHPHLSFTISALLLIAQTVSPSILAGQRLALGNQVQMVGVGEKGVARCPCSGETTYTHTLNLWHSAVLEADCVARLLSLLQIMSHYNRDKWYDSRSNDAASSSSLWESKPRGSRATWIKYYKHSFVGRAYAKGKFPFFELIWKDR